MSIITKYLPFVNDQIAFHEKQAGRFSVGKFASEFRVKAHSDTKDKFTALSADLIKADALLDSAALAATEASEVTPTKLTLGYEEVEGLPEELIKELSSASVLDKGDAAILQAMDAYGGFISLDRLLIDLFKKTGEINKRTTLTSRLYRMSQKGLVYGVPGKKGFYSKKELTEDEALKLFGEPEKTP